MRQQDLLSNDAPTLMRMPSWLGADVREERELPLLPGDYEVTPGEDRWTVRCRKTGQIVYNGIGPVEVVRSPAPS
ncbi:hypothetical protein [Variovorax sp. KK3]|nr:hypothetical protein [Variovorax sp. KK3]